MARAPSISSTRRALVYGAAGVSIAALAGALVIAGPAGPMLAGALARGQDVWRLGKLDVRDVSGPHLGDLHIARATVSDAHGVWAVADNLDIKWAPLRLLAGQAAIERAHAARLVILRQPNLTSARAQGASALEVVLNSLVIDRIDLQKGVAGPPANFRLHLDARTRQGQLGALHLDLTRFDQPLDALAIAYDQSPTLKVKVNLVGTAGGAFAALAGVPQGEVRVEASGAGEAGGGGAQGFARVGARLAAQAALSWTPQGWRAKGGVDLDAAPLTAPWRARLGSFAHVSAWGAPPRRGGAPFHASFASADLKGEADGKLGDRCQAVGPLALSLQARSFQTLAPELALQAGSGATEGAVDISSARVRYTGRLRLQGWRRGGSALSANGRIELVADAERVQGDLDLASQELSAPSPALTWLLTGAHLSARGFFTPRDQSVVVEQARASGQNFEVRGAGSIGRDGGALKGEWRAQRLETAFSPSSKTPARPPALLSGALVGVFAYHKSADASVLDVDGQGVNIAGPAPLAGLLGRAPRVSAKLSFARSGARLEFARVSGQALRVGAAGVLVGRTLDARVEASARGPLELGGARLADQAIDATGRITGTLDAPRLYGEAGVRALEIGGANVEDAKLTLDLVPASGRADNGRIGLTALVANKPLLADARVRLGAQGASFDDIKFTLAQLTGEGRAQFSADGPSGVMHLAGALDGWTSGVSGSLDGVASIDAAPAGARKISLSTTIRHARWGRRFIADSLSAHLSGPLASLQGDFSLRGWAGDERLKLDGALSGAVGAPRSDFTMSAAGAVGDAALSTRTPARVALDEHGAEISAALNLGAGAGDLKWREQGARLDASVRLDRAPLPTLTALADQPMAGEISGALSLNGPRSSLAGDLNFTLAGARLARRSRDSINASVSAHVGAGALRGALDARSQDGLIAHIDGSAPLVAEAAPFRLTPAGAGAGQAHWNVKGPVEGLWALLGPLDQSLTGSVDGAGQVQFGRGGVGGEGALSLASGAFEDKVSGVKLRDIDARVEFDQRGMRLARFSASEGKSGRLSGSGRLDGAENGRLALKLVDMPLVDRAEAKAVGGGDVGVEWKDGAALVTGEIKLSQAELRSFGANAGPSIPLIDVVEVNRAGPPARVGAPATVLPVKFNLHVYAPGRILTHTRGLDAEWSLDVRLSGDANAPLVQGSAQLVRGAFSLGGRSFQIDSGEIRFTGAPEDAEVNMAATATTTDLTAHVAISGRALDPQIAFTSEPALPEDEVLPQLLFASASRDLSPLDAAELAASLATLTGRSTFDVAGAARAAVNLDRLDVHQDASGFLVTGGKYLTRDVYLEVARGSLGDTSTSLQWQVRPRLYVISSFSATGDQSLALRWKHDY